MGSRLRGNDALVMKTDSTLNGDIGKKNRLRTGGFAFGIAAMDYQPMSLNSSSVRSIGAVTEWDRSALIDGSINWLRVAVVL